MAKKEKIEQPKWVKHIDSKMTQLIDHATDERDAWSDDVEEALGFYHNDRSVIFANALSKESRRDPNLPAQYHIPLVRQYVDSFVASTTQDDIKIRYVPKIDQQGVDMLARMGNALFDSYRTHIGWDGKIHALALHTVLFGRGYMGLYVDEVQDFPEPRADIRLFNAWQVYATPGVPFKQATEVVTRCWIDREELKVQYPEFGDELDIVSGADDGSERTGEMDGSAGGSNKLPWDGMIAGYNGQNMVVSSDAVLVRERWRFDPSYEDYPEGQSERDADDEHTMLRQFIVDPQGQLPDPAMLLEDGQDHDAHSIDHMMFIDQLRKEQNTTARMPSSMGMGMMVEMPTMPMDQRAKIDQVIALLMTHEQMHVETLGELEEWQIGKQLKYLGGWRHSIVAGESDACVGLYDGYSKFYEFGIQGVPIYEFNVQPNPMNFWVPSYACLLVDHNKLLNRFMNSANDNFAIFGNHQWWYDKSLESDPGFHISTDPRVPSTFPMNAMQSGKVGLIEAKGIPSDIFNMIQMVQTLAQQTSGVFGSLRGERQQGVRSGQHEQFLAQANRAQLDSFHRLWKNSLEDLCSGLFLLMLAYPPDDTFVKPMLDSQTVPIDYKVLEDTDFMIEVIMSPGGTSSTEERQSMLLGIVQNISQHPLIATNPKGLLLMLKMFADALRLDQPLFYEAMTKYIGELEQQADQMQQQQMMAAQQGMNQPPPTQGGAKG